MNPPMKFRMGCEVYTWFMAGSGQVHANRLDHMIAVAAQSGFEGIEPIHGWMGDLADPGRLAESLARHRIALPAVVLAQDWNGSTETQEERAAADDAIDLLTRFPGTLLCLVQRPTSRDDVVVRRQNLLGHLHRVALRARERGVPCTFHPNSPHASITRTPEDYAVLLDGLDPTLVGWTPDVGHLINGGMDPLTMMRGHAELINHVHFKDWDGAPEFALMGRGTVDFHGITAWLRDRGYAGWIICEDEGPEALSDPDGTTRHDGAWLRDTLLPALATESTRFTRSTG